MNSRSLRVLIVALTGTLASSAVCSEPGPSTIAPHIRLRYATFDPLVGAAPSVPPGLADDGTGRVVLVQFDGPPTQAHRDAIVAAGGRVLHFLTNHTHVVGMDPSSRATIAAIPGVRWVGPYHPAYRLDAAALARVIAGDAPTSAERYAIEAFDQDAAPRVARALSGAGARVFGQGGRLVLAALTPGQLALAARLDDVNFIDPWGPAGLDMDIARQLGGAHPFLSGLGFTGQDVRAEVLDTGLLTTHVAIQHPPPLLHGPNSPNHFHGTSVYGIVFADASGDPQATGMLPTPGQGIFAAYTQLTEFGGPVSRGEHIAQLIDPAGPYRAVFQTSSIGSPQVYAYTTISAALDDAVFTHDFLVTQSMGNTGNHLSRPQAWAKNVVAVGGVTHFNTLARADDTGGTSAFGAAPDGRIKPDLCHIQDSVYTIAESSPTSYVQFGGTSASTPIVAGHFGLIFQMWHEGVWAGFGGGKSVFDDRPHLATIRALAFNGASPYDWTMGGPNASITRGVQGWGLPDVAYLYSTADRSLVIDASDPLTQGQTRAYEVTVAPGETQLRVTMVYTDPAGNPAAIINRINDLDLRVTAPGGGTYWGNHGLWEGVWSTPDGDADAVDPIENVFVLAPAAGVWRIEVIGREIVQDANPATPGVVDAPFALVVTGAAAESCYPDCDGSGSLSITDFICFQTGFALGDPYADCDGNGTTNINDFICFQTKFALGC